MDPDYSKDKTYFLKRQIQALSSIKHSLDRITFVVSHDPEEPIEYKSYLENLPLSIGTAKVEVLRRPNDGYMFGAWAEVYNHFHDDYIIVCEDDYVPTLDLFDQILVEEVNKRQCDFLCMATCLCHRITLQHLFPELQTLPAIYDVPVYPIGIIPKTTFEKLELAYGTIPYSHSVDYDLIDQGRLFHYMANAGLTIRSIVGYSAVTHLHHYGPDHFYTYGAGPTMFEPVVSHK